MTESSWPVDFDSHVILHLVVAIGEAYLSKPLDYWRPDAIEDIFAKVEALIRTREDDLDPLTIHGLAVVAFELAELNDKDIMLQRRWSVANAKVKLRAWVGAGARPRHADPL